jgi:hypothetical protein
VLSALLAAAAWMVPSVASAHAGSHACVGISDALGDTGVALRSGGQTTQMPSPYADSAVDLARVTIEPADLDVRFHVASLQPNRPGADQATASWWAHFQAGGDRYWVLASSDAPVVNAGNWSRGGYHIWRNGHELPGVIGGMDTTRNTVYVKASRVLGSAVAGLVADSESTLLVASADGSNNSDLRSVDDQTGDAVPTAC